MNLRRLCDVNSDGRALPSPSGGADFFTAGYVNANDYVLYFWLRRLEGKEGAV